MIHSIKIKNLFSIKEEQIVSFEVDKNVPESDNYIKALDKRISRLNLFVGGNGAGKTNIMRTFSFIHWFITGPRQAINNMVIFPYMTWFQNDNSNGHMELEITFSIKDIEYTYCILFSNSQLEKEELISRNKKEERYRSNILFKKTAYKEKTELNLRKYKIEGDVIKDKNLEKVAEGGLLQSTFISMIQQLADGYGIKEYKDILSYFQKMSIAVDLLPSGNLNNMPIHNLFLLKQDNSKKLYEKINNVLKSLDIGFDSFDANIKDIGNGNFEAKDLFEIHDLSGKKLKNPMQYSSNGTRRLFHIINQILWCMENKVPCIIDEFDIYLHYSIIEKIIDIVSMEENLQFIVSSHNHLIMNKFDKYQIFLVEKNDLQTEVYRLDSVENKNNKKPRNTENFFLNYISGNYGAINNI
jgi:uncharacterized protein